MATMQLRPPTKSLYRNLLISLVIFGVIVVAFAFTQVSDQPTEDVTLSKLVSEIEDTKVKKIEIRGDELQIERTDGVKQQAQKETSSALTEQLVSLGVSKDKLNKVELDVVNNAGMDFFINTILPFLIPFVLIAGFIWFTLRSVQSGNRRAMSFGQTRARETSTESTRKKIKFKDVAGMREAKEELKEIVGFLKHPSKFTELGARIPKGALLIGAPGTGKTLLARAVAGEANVPFFHLSGSEFVEMFVGVGASRVRDLFRKAKKAAPSLVFIDEIDAVGRQRGAGLGGSHDEREQTLNQILVEMDGFDTDTNVIVLAATNRPDVLDPALLRPGRFDRRVVIDRPDIKDREAILKVHGRNKVFAPDVDLHEVAQRTPGFTGADLENLLNEAAILAARRNLKKIRQVEVLSSIEKVMLGPERKSHILSPKEKQITAYHEAGHALVATMLPNTDPVHKVSLISRGMAGGYTLKVPTEDRHMHSKPEFLEDISVMLAGFITEKEVFGQVTTGASNDLRNATELARKLVIDFGMSDALGPITYGDKDEMVFLGRDIGEQRNYSESTAATIDGEVKKFIDQQYQVALGLIKKYRSKLDQIAKKLIDVETIERENFLHMFDDVPEAPKKHIPEDPKAEAANEIGHAEPAATEAVEPGPLEEPHQSPNPA